MYLLDYWDNRTSAIDYLSGPRIAVPRMLETEPELFPDSPNYTVQRLVASPD